MAGWFRRSHLRVAPGPLTPLIMHQIPSAGCKRTTRQLQLQCLALTAPLCRSTIAAPGFPAFSSARPGPSRHSGAAPAVPPGADDSHGPQPLSEPHRGHGGTMQAYPRGPRPVASVARPGRPSGAPGSRVLQPEDADDDAFSDFSDEASQTESLRSSIFEYVYENGRTYHSYRAGQYLLPNDELEQERLDLTHHVFLLTLDGAPCVTQLHDPHSILDLGTGTGMWAITMGDLYPSAEVIGTDLSPIQSEWVPPNVKFEIDDATLEWTFEKNYFDFIHARTLAGAIKDWPGLLGQCFNHIKPGGRVEISEGRPNFWCDDDTLTEDTATYKWLTEFRRLSEPLGFDIAPKLPEMLKNTGFQDVKFTQKIVPLGTWPKDPVLKELGRWFRYQFLNMALEAYTLAMFTRMGNWTNEEVQVLLALVREELKTNRIHVYTYTAFVTGQRPAA
ncbi:hypothetical protein ACCO45_003984 [Purpureocillium lilacinum]|uniref:Uncharacterized protein n=1 Tax=Purpureocillium lilacinum TaxID=33203 RepID=A0ACC4E1G0_PURLI